MQKDENHEECRPGDETALGNRDQQGEIFEQSNPRMLPGSLERKFFMRDTTYDSDRHDNKTPETKEQEIRRPGISRPTQAGQDTKSHADDKRWPWGVRNSVVKHASSLYPHSAGHALKHSSDTCLSLRPSVLADPH